MRAFVIVLFFFIPIFSFSQKDKVIYKDTQITKSFVHLDSILIVGMGSAATRIFLDDFSLKLSEQLKSDGIFCFYYFIGKDINEAKLILDTLQSQCYHQILTLFPEGTSLFRVKNFTTKTYYISSQGIEKTVSTAKIFHYEQAFHCKLHLNNESLTPLWAADVEVTGDLHKQKAARKFVDNIINSLRIHKYIQ